MDDTATQRDRQQMVASTGILGLDVIIVNGGFPRNRPYLVDGDPGAGKTTFALQFLLEGARLERRGAAGA